MKWIILLLLTNVIAIHSEKKYFRINKNVSYGKFLWGMMDSKGKVIIPPEFTGLGQIHNGVAWARDRNYKWGLINAQGKYILQPQFDDVVDFENGVAFFVRKCNRFLVSDCEEGEWGLISQKGEVLKEGGFNGVVKKKIEFEESPYFFGKANGELLPYKSFFSVRGYHYIYKTKSDFLKNKVFGGIDSTGKFVLSLKFHKIGDFHNGLSASSLTTKIRFGLINLEGNFTVPPEYRTLRHSSEICENPCEDMWFGIRNENGKGKLIYDVFDKNGKEVFKDKYYKIQPFYEGVAWVQKSQNGQWGLIDREGNELIDFKYDIVHEFSNNVARVKLRSDKNYLFINKQGEVIESLRNLKSVTIADGEFLWVRGRDFIKPISPSKSSFGLMRLNGEMVYEPQFSYAKAFNNGFAEVRKDAYRSLINKDLKLIYTPGINYYKNPDENYLWFTKEIKDSYRKEKRNFWGFADLNGNIIANPKSFERGYFSEGLSWFRQRYRKKGNQHILYYGLIDEKGKELIAPIFYNVLPFKNGLGRAMAFGGDWGYVNKKGKIIWWSNRKNAPPEIRRYF
ncbi:MAG: WG repeat-containing protein [Leptospiraceae bacterium]|nr:WG repeat-containing protein [Leptospiraceae bacterium]